jgi:mRNA-degrading endonuclease toxin of MazEF toxin-antitoxin module
MTRSRWTHETRRGRRVHVGNQLFPIVIVSAARFNPVGATFAVVLGVSVVARPIAVIVTTVDADPVRGHIFVARLRPLDATAVGARLGMLSSTALRQLDRALRSYLDMR